MSVTGKDKTQEIADVLENLQVAETPVEHKVQLCWHLWQMAQTGAAQDIIKQDGVATVLDVMEKHLLSAEVQAMTCGVLWELARDGTASKSIAQNGLSLVLFAVYVHSETPTVHAAALGALSELATVTEIAKEIGDPCTLDLLESVMKRFISNRHIQATAFKLLETLAHIPELACVLAERHVVEWTFRVMKFHSARAI